jgi:hypothetical protein
MGALSTLSPGFLIPACTGIPTVAQKAMTQDKSRIAFFLLA